MLLHIFLIILSLRLNLETGLFKSHKLKARVTKSIWTKYEINTQMLYLFQFIQLYLCICSFSLLVSAFSLGISIRKLHSYSRMQKFNFYIIVNENLICLPLVIIYYYMNTYGSDRIQRVLLLGIFFQVAKGSDVLYFTIHGTFPPQFSEIPSLFF